MNAQAILSRFSENRGSASLDQVVGSIFTLVNQGAIIQVSITGYMQCAFCHQSFRRSDQPKSFSCKHQTHRQCLLDYAAAETNLTMDPKKLSNLSCPICHASLPYSRFVSIVDQRKINEVMDQVNRKIAMQIQTNQKKERYQKIYNRDYDCGVCMESFKIENMITMDCDCHFCKDCVKFTLMEQIGEGKFKEDELTCPGCQKGPIQEQMLRNIIGAETTAKLIQFRRKHLRVQGMRFMECKGFVKKIGDDFAPLIVPKAGMTDPQKKKFYQDLQALNRTIIRTGKPATIPEPIDTCPAIFSFLEGEQVGNVICVICHLEQCSKGCPVTHPNQTCQQYKQAAKLNNMEDGGLQLLRRAGLKVVACPNPRCKTPIERISGCDWVKCRCGFQMCYICGVAWQWKCGHKNAHPPFNVAAFMARYK